MREILFRGKRKDNGEWIEGSLVCYPDIDIFSIIVYDKQYYSSHEALPSFKVIPETVGQYTGMTDKNGVKIFEGDVVKTKYGRICEVIRFTSPCFQGFDLRPLEDLHLPPNRFDMYAGENLEIIGNIYNNSDITAERRKDEND